MNKKPLIPLILTFLLLSGCGSGHLQHRKYVMWYQTPAAEWTEALPVGNGRLGGMLFGNPVVERLQVNEESLWGGMNIPNNNPGALAHMPEIRRLILEGRIPEAFALSEKYVAGIPIKLRSYQTVGDIYFHFTDTAGKITNYRRELDLETGIAKVSFKRDGNKIEYEVYSSAADNVMVILMKSKKKGGLDMSISMVRDQDAVVNVKEGRIDMEGQIVDTDDPELGPGGAHMKFFASLLPTAYDGKLTHDSKSLIYRGGTELVMFFNAATDYNIDSLNFDRTIDPRRKCTDVISTASWKSFERLKKSHIEEHSAMFNRVNLKIGDDREADSIPTDERLRRFQAGADDPGLIATYFQYGRYLLMGSSRGASTAPRKSAGYLEQGLPGTMGL